MFELSCLLHHITCMCIGHLWIKVQIKSEFMNDALTNPVDLLILRKDQDEQATNA